MLWIKKIEAESSNQLQELKFTEQRYEGDCSQMDFYTQASIKKIIADQWKYREYRNIFTQLQSTYLLQWMKNIQ